jgi:hypothetical protein
MEHGWAGVFDDGSRGAEQQVFLELAEKMLAVQESNREKLSEPCEQNVTCKGDRGSSQCGALHRCRAA